MNKAAVATAGVWFVEGVFCATEITAHASDCKRRDENIHAL
jgi:hypothetical protein